MSFQVMELVYQLKLPTNRKFVLVTLAKFASDDGSRVFPSVATVARLCGLATRTVQRCLKSLVMSRILVIGSHEKGGRHPRVYAIDLQRVRDLLGSKREAGQKGDNHDSGHHQETDDSVSHQSYARGDTSALINNEGGDDQRLRDDTEAVQGCQSLSPDSSGIVINKRETTRDKDDTNHTQFGSADWAECQEMLATQFGQQDYNSWIKLLCFKEYAGGVIYLKVPSRFISDYVREHFQLGLQETLGLHVQIDH
ncbi:MAG: hypothetical protein FVQ81_09580 [Candidatus Glassbacteria bacterium]|nr:hypothetical protein [Candidatus Glassbacteria bacterium]